MLTKLKKKKKIISEKARRINEFYKNYNIESQINI